MNLSHFTNLKIFNKRDTMCAPQAFFLIEAKMEAMGQKREFGQT